MYLCPTWVAACCPSRTAGVQQYLLWLGIWVVCVTFPGYAGWSAVRACLMLEFCGILLWDYVCCVILACCAALSIQVQDGVAGDYVFKHNNPCTM